MTDIEININKHAQNKLTDTEIMNWFDQFELTEQKKIRDRLAMFIQQAHPTEELIKIGIQTALVKDTMTPVVLLKTKSLNVAIRKIRELPDSELRKSFIIMLSIFKTADIYRRESFCKKGCTHEWHNLD